MCRYTLTILTVVLFLSFGREASALEEPTFPYTATIDTKEVYVRSGPGKRYYPTEKLQDGEQVEVYRHDPGGWLAIRPPKGSFTWISRRYLNPIGKNLAEITRPRVAARVGSRFSDARDVIQVRLHEGERVELLPIGKNDPKSWARIAPPSGEFRWISSKLVDSPYQTEGIRQVEDRSSPILGKKAANTRPSVGTENRRPTASNPKLVTLVDTPPDESAPLVRSRPLSSEAIQSRLDQLQAEFSLMVAEDTTKWSFDSFSNEAESLLNVAETAVDRGKVRLFLRKIDEFSNLQTRHEALATAIARTDRENHRLATLGSRAWGQRPSNASRTTPSAARRFDTASTVQEVGAKAPATSSAELDRFDGVGRLVRIPNAKEGSPHYALVNKSGGILCYVTPSPGVNLRYYEKRVIGINGSRGYVPEQRAQHVMAKHVQLLEQPILR